MKLLPLICLAYAIISPAYGDELWLCHGSEVTQYQAPRDIPGESCRQMTDAEIIINAAPVEQKQEKMPASLTRKFCAGQLNASCAQNGDGELGAIGGVGYSIKGVRASVASAPEADPLSTSPLALWLIYCSKDKITLRSSCMVSHGRLYIFFGRNGEESILVGSNHFPGSVTSMRIGAQRFDTRDRDGEFGQSKKIMPLLKDGATVVTRHMKWPYRTWEDDEYKLHGIEAAVKIAKWMLKNSSIE